MTDGVGGRSYPGRRRESLGRYQTGHRRPDPGSDGGSFLKPTAGPNPVLETPVGRYFTSISYLHGSCFYNGMFGPDTDRRILQTSDYIEDGWFLAHSP